MRLQYTWLVVPQIYCVAIQNSPVYSSECSPGSFLVRPSEWTPGDYALAFRTKKEIRHWKIVQENDNYFVYPRPHPYDSLDDVVQVGYLILGVVDYSGHQLFF